MTNLMSIDIKPYDVHLLLASLKVAEIKAGDDQHWEIAKNISKLHKQINTQVFAFEKVGN